MPSFTTDDDVELFYTDEGEGRPVLLLHGWACDGTDWAWLDTDLARDHRVIVVDHRGHGRSGPATTGYTPHLFAADAHQLIRALGLHQVVVVGHSMGTIIASVLAVERPEVVSGLALVDPVYGKSDDGLDQVLAGITRNPHGAALAAFASFYGDAAPNWLAAWHRRRLLGTPANVVRDALTGLYSGPEGVGRAAVGRDFLARRRAPILAVYAGASGHQSAEWDRSVSPASNNRFEVWAEHGHFLHEEDPARFAHLLRDWLPTVEQSTTKC